MTPSVRCPECGGSLMAGSQEGMCARCLLAAALRHPGASVPSGLPQPGEWIGSCRVVRLLGEGGMGMVYLAEQERPIARQVALKIIKLGMDTRAVLARFQSEQQALALMEHPNIAQVYEAGSSGNGRPYFVMEHVPGIPITDYCDRQHLDTRQRLDLFLRVANAVQHAHQKGVIHRDLKPSNILVMQRDGEAVPKIIDFGLSKATERNFTEETLFTEAGVLIGTPEYMSPEQASRDGRDVDTRTDIYSLGVLLYELLVGAVPFDSKALRHAGYDEIRRIIREEDPPVPTTRLLTLGAKAAEIASCRGTDAGGLRNAVRGDLEWITMKALEKECARRYPSASEMAADIQHYLRDEPVTAGPAGAAYRLRKFVTKNRFAVSAVAVIFLLLALGLGVSSALYVKADRQRVVAQRESYIANIAAASSAIEHSDPADAGVRLDSCERSLRGWEWRYLNAQLDSSVLALWGRGYTNKYPAFAFSGGGIVWSSGENVNFWPAGSHLRSGVYGGFGEILALSRDGGRIVARPYRDHKILRILNPVLRDSIVTLNANDSGVECAAFSPDDGRILSGLSDGRVLLWSVAGKITAQAQAGSSPVTVAGFSPDATRLVSGSKDGMLHIWDANGLRLVATLRGHSGEVTSAAFSPDGRMLASASADRTIRFWDLGAARQTANIPQGKGQVKCVTFSPDGKYLVYGAGDSSVRVLAADSGKTIATLIASMQGGIGAVAFQPGGSRLFASSDWGEVLAWDAATWEGGIWKQSGGHIESLAFNADGSRILAYRTEGLQIWDGYAGTLIAERGPIGPSSSPTFSSDGKRAAWGDFEAKIWDGTAVRTLKGHHGFVTTPAFSPDGRLIASGSDHNVRIWDAASGTLLRTLDLYEQVVGVFFSPDGSQLLTSSGEWNFKLWSAASWKLRVVLEREPARRRECDGHPAFSPDGRHIVCGADSKIAIWDSRSGRLLAAVAEEGATRIMGFSPDGTRFLSFSEDGLVRVWDAQSFRPLLTLHNGEGMGWAGFTPDGNRILFATSDGTVRQWDTRSNHRVEVVRFLSSLENIVPQEQGTPEALVHYIRNAANLDVPVRQAALQQLEAYGELFSLFADNGAAAAWKMLSPRSGLAAYREVLGKAQRMAAAEPSDGGTLNLLGAAQYRVGQFQEAVATLEHCQELRKCPAEINTAFLAMAQFRLGRAQEAQSLLTQLRKILPEQRLASHPEERDLLREVESLVAAGNPR
jgi:WD40 repeat protein